MTPDGVPTRHLHLGLGILKNGPASPQWTVWVKQHEGGWDPIDCTSMDGVMEVIKWMEGAELRIVRNLATVEPLGGCTFMTEGERETSSPPSKE